MLPCDINIALWGEKESLSSHQSLLIAPQVENAGESGGGVVDDSSDDLDGDNAIVTAIFPYPITFSLLGVCIYFPFFYSFWEGVARHHREGEAICFLRQPI